MTSAQTYHVERVVTQQEIEQVLEQMQEELHSLRDAQARARIAEKLANKGVLFAVYKDKTLMGIASGYANDTVTRCGFGNELALKKGGGLLRARTLAKLLYALVDFMEQQGMEFFRGEVAQDNLPARRTYEQLGMQYVGKASENTIYMQAELREMKRRLADAAQGKRSGKEQGDGNAV